MISINGINKMKKRRMKKMASIYIYDEDLQKLMAMATWKKFKGWSYADIIGWMLKDEVIRDEIHSFLKLKEQGIEELGLRGQP